MCMGVRFCLCMHSSAEGAPGSPGRLIACALRLHVHAHVPAHVHVHVPALVPEHVQMHVPVPVHVHVLVPPGWVRAWIARG